MCIYNIDKCIYLVYNYCCLSFWTETQPFHCHSERNAVEWRILHAD